MNTIHLKQQVQIKNVMIRNIQKRFLSWGHRKTYYNPKKNIRGSPSPLWINPSPSFYKTFFILCIIGSILLVGTFSLVQVYSQILSAVNKAQALLNNATNSQTNNTQNNQTSNVSVSNSNNSSTNNSTSNSTNSNNSVPNSTNSTSNSTNSTTNSTNSTLNSTNSNSNSTNSKSNSTNSTSNSTNSTTNKSQSDIETENSDKCMADIKSALNPFQIIIGSIILFVNGMMSYFLYSIDYASDEEWSRYMYFNGGAWVALTLYAVLGFLETYNHFQYYKLKTTPGEVFTLAGASSCKNLYILNLVSTFSVNIICSVLSFFQFMKSLHNLRKFFIPFEGEDLTAFSEDGDLIIL